MPVQSSSPLSNVQLKIKNAKWKIRSLRFVLNFSFCIKLWLLDFRPLVLLLQEDRIVITSPFESSFLKKGLLDAMFLIDEQADRVRSLQEAARHLRQTACPITLTTLFEINVNAFEINDIRCFSDDVGLED